MTAAQRTGAVVLGVLLSLVAAAPPAPAHYPTTGARECRSVSYEAYSDYGASVWAKGVSCRQARRLAWDFYDRRYGVIDAYACTSRGRRNGDSANAQAHTDTRCVRRGSRGRKVVTLVRW